MSFLIICSVALLASALTFFSGFGLGTLLLPAFALFVPIEQAVVLTAVVHFLNGLFKLALVGRFADRGVLLRFGLPAVLFALLGAWLLDQLADLPVWYSYTLGETLLQVTAIKLVIGLLLIVFALFELIPALSKLSFPPKLLPLGGALSGFFGGLSGMQGALRSAFLLRAGLDKQAFIATGVVIACLIDVSRLGIYSSALVEHSDSTDWALLVAAVASAFAGAWLGNRYLQKITLVGVQRMVAVLLFAVAIGLISGWL
jgi:hypothetical protein